jgi:hypothetical protein
MAALLTTTALTMAADAAVSDGWTAPGQLVSGLSGSGSCGVADDVSIPFPASMRSLQPRSKSARQPEDDELARILQARQRSNIWYRLPADPIGIFVGGRRSADDEIEVAWGRRTERGVQPFGGGVVAWPAPRGRNRGSDWSFLSEEAFPERPPGADSVLIASRRSGGRPSRVTTSAPVTFRRAQLSALLTDKRVQPAVDPFYFEAMPCARLPTLAYGLADPPQLFVEWIWGPNLFARSSPFGGAADTFLTFSVPVERQGRSEDAIVVHWAVSDPRESVAPASRRAWLE